MITEVVILKIKKKGAHQCMNKILRNFVEKLPVHT